MSEIISHEKDMRDEIVRNYLFSESIVFSKRFAIQAKS